MTLKQNIFFAYVPSAILFSSFAMEPPSVAERSIKKYTIINMVAGHQQEAITYSEQICKQSRVLERLIRNYQEHRTIDIIPNKTNEGTIVLKDPDLANIVTFGLLLKYDAKFESEANNENLEIEFDYFFELLSAGAILRSLLLLDKYDFKVLKPIFLSFIRRHNSLTCRLSLFDKEIFSILEHPLPDALEQDLKNILLDSLSNRELLANILCDTLCTKDFRIEEQIRALVPGLHLAQMLLILSSPFGWLNILKMHGENIQDIWHLLRIFNTLEEILSTQGLPPIYDRQ